MEIHFVHKSKAGKVAVIAVLVEAGDQNPVDVPDLRVGKASDERKYGNRGYRNPADIIKLDSAKGRTIQLKTTIQKLNTISLRAS